MVAAGGGRRLELRATFWVYTGTSLARWPYVPMLPPPYVANIKRQKAVGSVTKERPRRPPVG
jgi:hypothetical protein